MNVQKYFETVPADMRAHAIAMSLEALISEVENGADAGRIIALARQAQERAEALTDDLDPCNPAGLVAPLYPDVVPAADLAATYGDNVVAFRPR